MDKGKKREIKERCSHADGKDKDAGREKSTRLKLLKPGPGEIDGLSAKST